MSPQKHATLELLRAAVPELLHRVSVSDAGIPDFGSLSEAEFRQAMASILERRPDLRQRLAAGLEGRCAGCDD
jgi:hypothetical protein